MPGNTLKITILALLILQVTGAFHLNGQEKFTVRGTVTDASTKQPIPYANVIFVEMPLGCSTNDKGVFTLQSVPAGRYNLTVSYIGYDEQLIPINLTKDITLSVEMKELSLGLEEVTVTAERSKSGATASRIRSEAISHVQASSLKDVMQLIPGNLATNPNLRDPERITIREVGSDINSALGTAVIIDGIPLSNDGNLQKSINTVNDMSSVAGGGIDIRSISVDNIESITVDVGIPSAEHGNLTSGAVYIKTKAGGSPLTARVKADPYSKQGYLGKGLVLKNDKGVINLDFDYTRAYGHIIKRTSLYNRAGSSLKYTRTFFRGKTPLDLEGKLRYNSTLDGEKWDPDMVALEENYSRNQQFNASLQTTLKLNKPFVSDLTLETSFTKGWDRGFEKTLETSSSGATFFSSARESGEYQISYGPSSYYSEVTYDGKPYTLFVKMKARLFRKTGFITHNALLGSEWNTTGNRGEGRTFDQQRPPSGTGTRPRAFSDIPALNSFSLFAENKMIMELGTTRLDLMAGVRMDNIQPSGPFSTNGSLGFDPRLNIRYNLLNKDNSGLFKDLSFRFGYGKTTKSPTLYHLYPDKDYNDIVSFNYYPELIVTTTTVIHDTRNYDLKPARSNKKEIGLDLEMGKMEGRITAFSEKHTGGYIQDNILFPQHYRDYDVISAGLKPYYLPGDGVYYKDLVTGQPVKVGFEDDVRFASWSVWRNGSVRIKEGIEYSLDFGKIRALRTSVNLMGAWFRTESFDVNTPYWEREDYTVFENGVSQQHFFVVKFPTRSGYGVVDQRLNTNIGLDTHIPELKMLVSFTTQIIWFEKNKRVIRQGESRLYSLSELREYLALPELFKNEKEGDMYYYLPVSHMGYDYVEIPYSKADFAQPLAQQAIKKLVSTWFPERTLPPLALCNIKLSKEIGKRYKLSFYANNFLNIRPYHLDSRSGQYLRRNEKPFFGADLTVEL